MAVLRPLAIVLALVLSGACASSSSGTGTFPPAGTIWFGQAVNPQTLVVSGRATTFARGGPLAFVASLTRPSTGETLGLAITGSGELGADSLGSIPAGQTVIGELISPDEISTSGTLNFSVIDASGAHLADGALTITPAAPAS
ncbi:MAG: hypothetical protein ACLQHS_13370 [Candidatus Limnocylindrales bacterium]